MIQKKDLNSILMDLEQMDTKHEPVEVNSLMKCKSKESALQAEKIIYENMWDYHGQNKVRGAYYTKSQ